MSGVLPRVLHRDEKLQLWWLLLDGDAADVARAISELQSRTFANYAFEFSAPPERRTFATLENEATQPSGAHLEIELDFLAGAEFLPEDSEKPWGLSSQKFIRLLNATAQRVLGHPLCADDAAGIELLPWFWSYDPPLGRESRSQPGHIEWLGGCRGPLLVRGNWQRLWAALLLAREWHLGRGIGKGQGFFEIHTGRPVLDHLLARPELWLCTREDLLSRPQAAAAWRNLDESATLHMAAAVQSRSHQPAPASPREVEKPDGPPRITAVLPPTEKLLHSVLHRILQPVGEKLLDPAAIAYRRGHGIHDVRRHFVTAIEHGCTYGVRCDIASFFDEIPWPSLDATLDHFLPVADAATRAALTAAIRTPWIPALPPRTRGILQGSPLSPLLSNLFLAAWDAALAARGHRHIRYGDDLFLFATGESEASSILAEATSLLTPLGLRLRDEKTRIAPLAEGIRYLGLDLELLEPAGATTQTAPVRRPLVLTGADEWVGLEERSLTLRTGGEFINRIPLERISELHACGIGGFSSPLLRACLDRAIPVIIADAAGRFPGVLLPQGRTAWETLRLHAVRHSSLDAAGLLDTARTVLRAKLQGYLRWFAAIRDRDATALSRHLRQSIDSIARAGSVETLLGVEGAAAARIFGWLHSPPRIRDAAWHSARRLPRERKDRWNLLTDTLSHLLFHRISARLRAAGLHPFLGFLHSSAARFESLTCDVQEPFRARLDRFALRLVNLRIIRAEDVVPAEDSTFTFAPGVWARLVRALEEEMDTIRPPDIYTWRDLLSVAVARISDWAKGGELKLDD